MYILFQPTNNRFRSWGIILELLIFYVEIGNMMLESSSYNHLQILLVHNYTIDMQMQIQVSGTHRNLDYRIS